MHGNILKITSRLIQMRSLFNASIIMRWSVPKSQDTSVFLYLHALSRSLFCPPCWPGPFLLDPFSLTLRSAVTDTQRKVERRSVWGDTKKWPPLVTLLNCIQMLKLAFKWYIPSNILNLKWIWKQLNYFDIFYLEQGDGHTWGIRCIRPCHVTQCNNVTQCSTM